MGSAKNRDFGSRLARFHLDLAALLEDRLHRVRAATALGLGDRLGRQPRWINSQSEGSYPLSCDTWLALAEDDPEGARLLIERMASELGRETVPLVGSVDGQIERIAGQAGGRAGRLAALVAEALGDGTLSEAETRALEEYLPGAIESWKRLAARLAGRKVETLSRRANP